MFDYIQKQKILSYANSSLHADPKRTLLHLAARYDSVFVINEILGKSQDLKSDVNAQDSILL